MLSSTDAWVQGKSSGKLPEKGQRGHWRSKTGSSNQEIQLVGKVLTGLNDQEVRYPCVKKDKLEKRTRDTDNKLPQYYMRKDDYQLTDRRNRKKKG